MNQDMLQVKLTNCLIYNKPINTLLKVKIVQHAFVCVSLASAPCYTTTHPPNSERRGWGRREVCSPGPQEGAFSNVGEVRSQVATLLPTMKSYFKHQAFIFIKTRNTQFKETFRILFFPHVLEEFHFFFQDMVSSNFPIQPGLPVTGSLLQHLTQFMVRLQNLTEICEDDVFAKVVQSSKFAGAEFLWKR